MSTEIEIVSSPIDIGKTAPRSQFARVTTVVRDSLGNFVAASGDREDAFNIALGLCQARMQPYDSEKWTHDVKPEEQP